MKSLKVKSETAILSNTTSIINKINAKFLVQNSNMVDLVSIRDKITKKER